MGAALALLGGLLVGGCASNGDPRSVEGALAKASSALAARDARQLFRVIDQRARHAMDSIVKSRREAARIVRESYPEAERAAALAGLGDAAEVEDSAGLFARRCDARCLDAFAAELSAPKSLTEQDGEVLVTTARGARLRLFRGTDTWYGLVWNTDALSRERDRAAAELEQVRQNAALYREQRTLE